jgi:hypothetical protein
MVCVQVQVRVVLHSPAPEGRGEGTQESVRGAREQGAIAHYKSTSCDSMSI